MKKTKTTARSACPTSPTKAHYFPDVVQAYDEQRRCGDTGTCAYCGLTRFWLRPSPQEGQWTSLQRRRAAA